MSLFEIAAFLAFAINLLLTIFVFTQKTQWLLRRAYLLWGGGLAVWNIAAFFMYRTGSIDVDQALLCAKMLAFGIILAPLGFCELTFITIRAELPRWFVRTFYTLQGILLLSLYNDWLVRGVRLLPQGYWLIPGPMFWVWFVSYAVLMTTPTVKMWVSLREARSL